MTGAEGFEQAATKLKLKKVAKMVLRLTTLTLAVIFVITCILLCTTQGGTISLNAHLSNVKQIRGIDFSS